MIGQKRANDSPHMTAFRRLINRSSWMCQMYVVLLGYQIYLVEGTAG